MNSIYSHTFIFCSIGGINNDGIVFALHSFFFKGNNIYGKDITAFLKTLPVSQRNEYIAMDLIKPTVQKNYIVNANNTIFGDTVSELGIFGLVLIIINNYYYYRYNNICISPIIDIKCA